MRVRVRVRVMPHMSKAALGHEARRYTPKKPCFSVNSIVYT